MISYIRSFNWPVLANTDFIITVTIVIVEAQHADQPTIRVGEPPPPRKNVYKYYEQLLFLLPTLKKRNSIWSTPLMSEWTPWALLYNPITPNLKPGLSFHIISQYALIPFQTVLRGQIWDHKAIVSAAATSIVPRWRISRSFKWVCSHIQS